MKVTVITLHDLEAEGVEGLAYTAIGATFTKALKQLNALRRRNYDDFVRDCPEDANDVKFTALKLKAKDEGTIHETWEGTFEVGIARDCDVEM